jgi:hypothetical protein
MRFNHILSGSGILIVLVSCAEQSADTSSQISNKPVTYLPGGNLFSLISPEGVDVSQPWNAKDQNLLNTLKSRALDGDVSINAVTTTTTPCDGGGVSRLIVDNQGPPWYSQGDVFTTTFEDCIRSNTLIVGQRQYSVDVLIGQQFIDPDWSLTTTISRDIVNTDMLTNAENANKGVATTEVVVTNTTQYLQTLSGSYESERPNNGQQVVDTAEYLVTYKWDEAPGGSYSWDFDLKTTSTNPVFADMATKTLETLSGPNNQAPETGKMQISRMVDGITSITTITATGAGSVLVELDNDGDGIVDSSSDSTWQQVVLDPFLYQFF